MLNYHACSGSQGDEERLTVSMGGHRCDSYQAVGPMSTSEVLLKSWDFKGIPTGLSK